MSAEKLLTIRELNWGDVNYPSDDWIAITRVVNTNGTVQTHVQKTLSGMMYSGVNGISEDKFDMLKELLEKFESNKGKSDRTACDGVGYEITLHTPEDKDDISYIGYIYNNDYLRSIVKLVCSH